MKRFLLLFPILACLQAAHAQVQEVTTLMERMESWYHTQPQSFAVKYIYANEHTPGKVLDSLEGRVEISGDDYRYVLDSTETIHNNRYNIILFKADKVMYLGTGATAAGADPVSQLRGILEKSGATGCSIRQEKQRKIIQIHFPEGGLCKQMEMTIDTVSKHLLSMQYIVKTTALMEENGQQPEGYDTYALVKADLYDYQLLKADQSRFDEHKFFYKEGTAFKATPAYSNYQLFIGTPKL